MRNGTNCTICFVIGCEAGAKPAGGGVNLPTCGQWLEKQGRAFEAAELLVGLEAWNDAAGVLVRSLESWILSGEMFRIEGLVERLPDEVIRTSPGLLFLKAIRSFNFGLYDESSQTLDALDAQLEKGIQLPDFGLAPISTLSGLAHEEALRTLSLFLRSHIASYSGRLQEASMLIRDLALRPELNASSFNAWIHYSIGTHEFVTGRLLAAKDHLSLAMGRAESDGNIFVRFSRCGTCSCVVTSGSFRSLGLDRAHGTALGPGWRLHPIAATLPHLRTMLLREEKPPGCCAAGMSGSFHLDCLNIISLNITYFVSHVGFWRSVGVNLKKLRTRSKKCVRLILVLCRIGPTLFRSPRR